MTARARAPQPMIDCPTCHGSGIDSARVYAVLMSRKVLTADEREREICCPSCDGQGRITIAFALASGLRIDGPSS